MARSRSAALRSSGLSDPREDDARRVPALDLLVEIRQAGVAARMPLISLPPNSNETREVFGLSRLKSPVSHADDAGGLYADRQETGR
jgi:hypothetical protein